MKNSKNISTKLPKEAVKTVRVRAYTRVRFERIECVCEHVRSYRLRYAA